MDWTEKQQCVLCENGGNLLVCNGDGCPISVHKNCMGCEAHFDDFGNFYCPYCVYKRFTAEASQLRSKVMLTKKALSTFLEEETRDENNEEPTVEMSNKESEISSKDKSVDENHCFNLGKCDEIHETLEKTDGVFKRTEEFTEINNVNTCRMMIVYKPNTDRVNACDKLEFSKRIKVDKQTGNDKYKFKVVDQQKHDTSIEDAEQSKSQDIWSTIEKKITCNKRNNSVAFNKNGRKEESIMEHGAKKGSKQLSVIHGNIKHRVYWSEQEEEMLKEGVQKYSLLTRKNLPWKKILEFGRHVFDSSRTPTDLKDKWRKIAK